MRYNIMACFNNIEGFSNFQKFINSKIPKEDVELRLINPEEIGIGTLIVDIGYNNPDDEMDIIRQIKLYGRIFNYSGTVVVSGKVEEWRGTSRVKRDDLKKISITVSDDSLRKLEANATRLGLSIAELVRSQFDELANQPEVSFHNAMTYVLNKNTELYQRLK